MAKVGDMNLTTEETKEHKKLWSCSWRLPQGSPWPMHLLHCVWNDYEQARCTKNIAAWCMVLQCAACAFYSVIRGFMVNMFNVQCAMCNVQFAVQLFRGKPALRATRLQIERLHSFHSRFGLLMRMMMIRIHNDHHHHHQTLDVSCAPCAH